MRRLALGWVFATSLGNFHSLEWIIRAWGVESKHITNIGGSGVARGQGIQPPSLLHGLQNGRVVQRHRVRRYAKNGPWRDQRRNNDRGHTNPKPLEVETVFTWGIIWG